jgi:two-component system sensor histidine kinase CreC
MNIYVRFFLGYFLILGLAAWLVFDMVLEEIEPAVRQVAEESLVDASQMLAALAAEDLAHGRINDGQFAIAVRTARSRVLDADIYGIKKEKMDFRVYVTDTKGKVLFDSDNGALGADFSRWRDISLTLRGEYGARTTRENPADPFTSYMYVAAPIFWRGELIGVLSLAKPAVGLLPYIVRMSTRIRESGFFVLAASAFIGLLFSAWLIWSIHGIIRYARDVSAGRKAEPPTGGGRQFSELAHALALMRERLEGKQYVEKYVQNLTHEMKSPLTAVLSAAELLEDPLPETERRRFAGLILEQGARLQQIIDRMLQLARVEQLQRPEDSQALDLGELARQAVAARATAFESRGLKVTLRGDGAFPCRGDAFLLQQAINNLMDNAIDFSPPGGEIDIWLEKRAGKLTLKVGDQGAGVPEYALGQIFERFYSLPHPATGHKSTGLGLPFVREVARLHGGDACFANRPQGGAEAILEISSQ